METKIMMDYLAELAANNDREWYAAHKADRQKATEAFEGFIGELMSEIGKFDTSVLGFAPKELTFKQVRDTRFSKDKSPYNPSFRAHISSKGKLPIPVGYYIMLRSGDGSFLGGGLFADMFANATTMVRDYISAHGDEWNAVVNDEKFKKYFTVKGASLKNVPAGYDKEHPQAEYLKFKSWYIEYPLSDAEITDCENFACRAAELFEIMKPFNDFLNRALKDFEMPSR
ncbi:MAG: DUF2461 domain-containing protein [Clostridia bacterium]|nr:DUF2461 domain-containing protein [Clostridia bacterium]